MVDLVKIRKKAKEKKKEKAGDADAAPAIEAGSEPERKKKVRRKSRPKKPPEKKKGERKTEEEESARSGRSAADDAVVRLDEFKRTAGLRIADDDNDEESDGGTTQADVVELLTFQIGEEMFSIDVGLVEQIIVPRDWTPVPNAPVEILGIFSLRGKIVTLIDVATILDLEWTWKEVLDSRIIVINSEGDTFGFRVDRVLRVARVEQAKIQPQPVVSGGERSEMITGIVTLDGKTISVLSVSRLTG